MDFEITRVNCIPLCLVIVPSRFLTLALNWAASYKFLLCYQVAGCVPDVFRMRLGRETILYRGSSHDESVF